MNLIKLILLICCILYACTEKVNQKPALVHHLEEESNWFRLSHKIKITQPWKIVYVAKSEVKQGKLTDYWQKGWDAFKMEGKILGIQAQLLNQRNSTSDSLKDRVSEQIRLLQEIIVEQSAEGIIIGAFQSDLLAPVIAMAKKQNIPVIAIDTALNSSDLLTFIHFDNFFAGRFIGNWITQTLKKAKVIVFTGPQAESNAMERRNGYLEGLSIKQIEVVDIYEAGWGNSPLDDYFENLSFNLKTIDAILCPNDRLAIKIVIPYLKKIKLNQKIMVTGFDATSEGLESVNSGDLAATVLQPIDQISRSALHIMINHLESGRLPPKKLTYPKITIVSQENLQDYYAP